MNTVRMFAARCPVGAGAVRRVRHSVRWRFDNEVHVVRAAGRLGLTSYYGTLNTRVASFSSPLPIAR